MQYHLRQVLVFLDACVMNKPEIMIGNVASRLNEVTREITDENTRNLITQQLSAFATFIERRGAQEM
jgi:chromate reductase, NAD(P)H dehydrogenase (quinone)